MKKLLFIVVSMFIFMSTSLAGEEINTKNDPQKLKFKLRFRGNLGRWDSDCKNLSFECIKLIIEISGGVPPRLADLSNEEMVAELIDAKTLVLNFKYLRSNSDGIFYVSAATVDNLNVIAKNFGYETLKLNPGNYPVKFDGDIVTATLPVTTK